MSVNPPEGPEAGATSTSVDVLLSALKNLPIGLTIRTVSDRRELYANPAAFAHHAQRGATVADRDLTPVYERSCQTFEVGGESYEVATSVDATEHARIEDELTKRAFFDDLTGLPKRDLFEQTITTMIAEDCSPFALSFIDIDNFKYINDYHGHTVGDEFLIKVARRIADSIRPTDVLARVGGDEFVLLTTPIDSAADTASVLEQLAARMREPFFINGHEIFSSASIGACLYPHHGQVYEVLRANADSAMYRIKESTKGGVKLFDAGLGRAATDRMELEQRIRLAIRDKRLCCVFQPQVDFRTDTIIGVEVLLRWRDDNGEVRPPGDFIKLAIELGLMDEITFLVLDQVVGQIDLINEAFGRDTSISLNIAAKQAGDLEFMTQFAEALDATGYCHRFIVELTEEAFLSKGEFQTKVLPMLRNIGARVSIDDFGVGYSSLSALAEITADELKVDRSFITDIHKKPRNQAILKVIESLGTALGMRVLVEGVETYEEMAYLMAATRISSAQGYYFAKPMFLQESTRPASRYGELRANVQVREPQVARPLRSNPGRG
jgi:diguanylate cyclase (GGDEF)-like protein